MSDRKKLYKKLNAIFCNGSWDMAEQIINLFGKEYLNKMLVLHELAEALEPFINIEDKKGFDYRNITHADYIRAKEVYQRYLALEVDA